MFSTGVCSVLQTVHRAVQLVLLLRLARHATLVITLTASTHVQVSEDLEKRRLDVFWLTQNIKCNLLLNFAPTRLLLYFRELTIQHGADWLKGSVFWKLICSSQLTVSCVSKCFQTRYLVQSGRERCFASCFRKWCSSALESWPFPNRGRVYYRSDWLCCWLPTYVDSHFTMNSWANVLSLNWPTWSSQVPFSDTEWVGSVMYRSIKP